jgi:hypothetical protein
MDIDKFKFSSSFNDSVSIFNWAKENFGPPKTINRLNRKWSWETNINGVSFIFKNEKDYVATLLKWNK